jgi:hypothetical protein
LFVTDVIRTHQSHENVDMQTDENRAETRILNRSNGTQFALILTKCLTYRSNATSFLKHL